MQNSNGGLFFSAEIDTDKFKKAADDMKKEFQSVASAADIESKRIDKIFSNIGQSQGLKKMFEDISRAGRGAFADISERAQQLVKDIQGDIVQLSQLEKVQSAVNDEYEAGKMSLEDYISAQARLSLLHDDLSEAIRTNEQALRNERQMLEISGDSMVAMQAQIAQLTTAYMKLSQAEREGAEGQAILKNLSDVQTKLQNATVAMGKYGGAATKQFNGLNFSLQQIVRELPSLAMGPQMFFLAISNNLPMFTDALAQARKENEALQAINQKGIPVWKQVAKSLFSWQTALVAGITVLITHGDQIGKWIAQLFTGKEAIDDVTSAIKSMNTAIDSEDLAGEIVNFEKLARAYKEIGDNAEEKKRFLIEYKEEIERTGIAVSDIYDADNLFIDNADNFIEAVKKRALALAGMELAKEQYQKAIQERVDNANKYEKRDTAMQNQNYYADLYNRQQAYLDEHPEISDNPLYLRQLEATKSNYEYWSNQVDKYNAQISDNIEAKIKEFTDAGDAYLDAHNQLMGEYDNILEKAGLDQKSDADAQKAAKDEAKKAAERVAAINAANAKISEVLDKNARERIRQEIDLENQVRQAEIDAMSEGYEKELAQRKLDNEKELQEIDRQKQEYIDAVVAMEKEAFEAQEDVRAAQDESYVKKIFDPKSVKVDTSAFDKLTSYTKQKQLKEEADALQQALKDYETYEQARLRIQEEYAEKRKMLMNEDGTLKDGVTQGNLDELARREQEAIDAISVTFAMRDEAFEQWSKSLAGKTADALELMLAEAEESLSILENTEGADPEDVAKAVAAINKLKAALANADKENKNSEVTWADLNETLRDSAAIFSELGNKIPGVTGELLSSIGTIATSAVSMANAIEGIGEAASAAEKASGVLAVISAAIQAISVVTDIIEGNRRANEAAAQSAWEYAEALEQIRVNASFDKYDTIFGEDALGRMQEAKKNLDEARASLAGLLSGKEGYSDRYLADKDLLSAYDRIKDAGDTVIVSDQRNWWQKLWDSQKNLGIFNIADYINDDMTVDTEGLQALLESWGDGMSEADQQFINSVIQDGQIINNQLAEIKEYASSIFGDVSSDIADSMISAFEETGDAANATFDEISQNIARNFAKNAIMNLLSEKIFTPEASEELSKLLATDPEGALEYFDSLMAQLEKIAPELAESINVIYGEYGGSSAEEPERTSTSKGVAQATQDSVDELKGRATTIQGHTFSISQDMKTLVNTSAMMLDRLAGIESNTAHLEMIDSNIASLSKEMGNLRSDLTMRGIKLAR